ncbi:type II secretion system protein [Pectobacterium zantedeschiae]|uniref:type II secretion system protein n=1 Tax=Pectobacterium zantedeschiae TaxID=2034769 RepID=UPI001F5CFB35|nr:type II secretion system protein [Pectobacterium zantedeschiae]
MHGQRGFTLIEMMVTLALLASLAAAAIPFAQHQQQKKKEYQLQESLRQIRCALDHYAQAVQDGRIDQEVGASPYPANLLQLVEGVADKSSKNKSRLYFLRSIPRDPFCDCEGKSDAETWRTRSSEQAPNDFTGGKDVFDIRSTSGLSGSNGVPYAQW